MKFTFAVQKMGKGDTSIAKGHNARQHQTASQLDESAWFDSEGSGYAVQWDDSKIERANKLSKRKDAVVALEFVVQIGNQTDWRYPPTTDCPEGKPRPCSNEFQRDFCLSVMAWADAEFGADNVVGIHLHLDESTPHIHLVVTPINEGKLQAKHWLDGGAKLGALRKRCYQHVNSKIECEYTPRSGEGGKPHREELRAGAQPVPSLLDKVSGHKKARELERENKALRERIAELEQIKHSRLKTRYNADRAKMTEQAELAAEIAQKALGEANGQIFLMQQTAGASKAIIEQMGSEIEKLKGYNRTLAEENNELEDKLRELQPARHSRGMKPS